MTSNNIFDQARNELDSIAQEIDEHVSCSHAPCRVRHPTTTLRVLVDLIEGIDGRSPVRRRLIAAVLSGLNIDSVNTGPPPPGVVLTESMKTQGFTVQRLSDLTGYSKKTIGHLRAGLVLPSHRFSLALEQAGLGTAAKWNQLTSEYKDWQLRQKGNK